MDIQDVLSRVWENLLARPSGPFAFRFLLQPIVCAALAVRDGLKDARTGRSPYFWTIVTDPHQRAASLREGIKATSRVLLLGIAMDVAYQLIRFGTVYPGETVIIVLVLAFLPYLLLRGPVARLARLWQRRSAPRGTTPR